MKALIIPSATLIPREMRTRFGDIPAVLYPLNGIPLIEYLYKQYVNIVDDIYIVGYKKIEMIEDYINIKRLRIKVIQLDSLNDLGYTISYGLRCIDNPESTHEIYINYADTLVFDDICNTTSNTCFFSIEKPNDVWTFYRVGSQNELTYIYDKLEEIENNSLSTLPFFVGLFYFKDWQPFYNILTSTKRLSNQCDSFYSALQEFSVKYPLDYRYSNEWFDVGHNENYKKAKTGVKAREFNTIEIDEARGILKKYSRNKEKFINEIKWYIKMPSKLQYLIPRIYDYSLSPESPYIAMEYYGYNTLHEIYLYGDIPSNKWKHIFEKLRFAIDDMSQYVVKTCPETQNSIYQMYVSKTISRLTQLKTVSEFMPFFDNDIIINEHRYHSLEYYINYLPKIIHELLIDNNDTDFNIIHGDLCFSNILLEEHLGFIRLIDPRGEFGTFDLYGDPRYEIAKLLHSIDGQYDYIIEDMFDISVADNQIYYQIQSKKESLLNLFKNVFELSPEKFLLLQLIESTLFLSMIPLHNDSITRQYAMLATGLTQLDHVMKETGYE